ncbi:reverse transcriptase family protein [Massilia horti]|uniref:RNA-directed DNA polymerase n=1 Tax=Massilia horti TaxID=2562153 RepID=A0A4Y9T331_9BURK|nr:reverse transcriptase family protein [Massilia horti]TFW33601.1 RNA-directed DNA polymerase [Massilia horti]
MRLPLHLQSSRYFTFGTLQEFIKASGTSTDAEIAEYERLEALGLPPISSRHSLALMLGVNPALIWSFEARPHRFYRTFHIAKGRSTRRIDAPRVGLKIVQKWLSAQLQAAYSPPEHVYGFVPNRSHVQAASIHCGAEWILSADIADFFPSTPFALVEANLKRLGFNEYAARTIASLSCLDGALAQGAPTSPVLSNICFDEMDKALLALATKHQARLSRYADDIVFSGSGEVSETLISEIRDLFVQSPWELSERKFVLSRRPNRLKVHGLLVEDKRPKLTKGYRNKLRAFRHLLANGRVRSAKDVEIMAGHLAYSDFVEKSFET